MSTPKHTPGPWKVENHISQVGPYTSAALEVWSQNRHIGTVNEHVDDLEIDKANAHLIAAAPDLLQTLIDIIELVNDHDLTEDSIRQHIATLSEQAVKKAQIESKRANQG